MFHSRRPHAKIVLGLLPLAVLITNCDSPPPAFVERPATYDGVVSQLDPSQNAEGVPTFAAAEWTFAATEVEKAELAFDTSSDIVDHTFKMKQLKVSASVEHQQNERAVSTEVFSQGSELENSSEAFEQNDNPSGLLDILVVIDNSGSMAEEQLNLSSKLSPLLSYVEESDWRVGVVTTDPNDGCLRGLISKGDQNYETAFANAVNAGTSGTGLEQGIRQAVNSLAGTCSGGQQWLRSNSTVAVLIVSDEDNCSDGTKCNGAAWESSDYLLDYLDANRELGVNARVYGLLWHPSEDSTQCSTALRQAPIYSEAIAASGGAWGSICDADYTNTLSAISLDLSVILKSQFALQYAPLENTVEILVDGVPTIDGVTIQGNVIEFDPPPAGGAEITVNYSFLVDPPKKEFTLYGAADGDTIEVFLDGSPADRFSYDEATKTVSFNKAPTVREIKIVYRGNQTLTTDFSVETGLESEDLSVSVNGESVASEDFAYVSESGLIRFASAPEDGAMIKVEYERPVGPQLSYPAFVPVDSLTDFEVFNASTETAIPFTVEGQDIVFSEADYEFGKEILVRYDNPFASESFVDLGYDMIEGSLQVEGAAAGLCESASYDGSQLDYAGCGFGGDEVVNLTFDFIRRHNKSFVLENLGFEIDESYRFSVFVNGEAVDASAFTFEDGEISFNEELPLFSTITVKLYRARDS